MKTSLLFYPFIFILLFQPYNKVSAQATQPDTAFLQNAIAGAVESYRDAVGLQAHLYSGPEYVSQVIPYLEGHQFFDDKTPLAGAVLYDGAWFYNVPMLYDVVIDEVAIYHPGNGISQRLVKEKVHKFMLRGHTFILLSNDSTTADSPVKAGFYDLLYKGDLQVLVKREKNIQERATSKGMEGNYEVVDKYYLLKEGAYHQVKSKRSVYSVLRDEKKQLQKFVRANKLKFRRNREEALVKVAQQYDTLKHESPNQ